MSDKQLIKLPNDIKAYLNEIAERLWSGHAAVMIGAGFSKNAKRSVLSSKGFPDWNQLGNFFYKKIHGVLPSDREHYLNVLKLADEVQAAFGRPALDQLIRTHVPDKEYEPSLLHTKLLHLPWKDVFTTNYDTLLERACINITSQRFDIVINKEDLVYSQQPRIIKLHGSLPSERPFIITEEDYRKYPMEFAPLVNTVQQALLENTLCLIGFSGDDPNFLQWIGWIRDNLGEKNAPKIYLIGIFNISDAKKKLLEQCNIVLIDMSHCPGIDGNHAKALDTIFEYLISRNQDNNKLEWPTKSSRYLDKQLDNISQIEKIVEEWKKQRISYPNWIIVPEDRRNMLWLYTENIANSQLIWKELKAPLDIELLYELNWRLEKSLCPIFDILIERYESIIEQFNPFPMLITIESAIYRRGNLDCEHFTWGDIQDKWLELLISLLRFYREEGLLDKWSAIDHRMQKLSQVLSPEITVKWYYERCLHALFSLNIPNALSLLENWIINENLPFWEAKRAGLMAELGNLNDAEKILEKSLTFIRSQLNLSPVLSDYFWVSQESYVMQLLQYVQDALILSKGDYDERERIRQRFNERWSSLKQFKCDPWNELQLFEALLKHEPINRPPVNKKHGFDIGKVTIQHHFGSTDTEALKAYSFLRYSEETAMAFRIPGVTFGIRAAEGALKRISKYSPYWALATLLRIGDSKLVDSMFDRESIFKMENSQVDRLIHEYLEVLQNAKPEIEKGDKFAKQNFGINLAGIIPEILSRLCVKCSKDAGDKIFLFLRETFSSEHRHKYNGISNLVKRLIGSWSNYEIYRKLPELLKIPILKDYQMDYPEPFLFVLLSRKQMIRFEAIQIDTDEVNQLLQKSKSNNTEERKRAVSRLGLLYEYGLLNQEQKKLFGDTLWSQVDVQTGFPLNTYYYKFVFLSLPHPEDINPYDLFRAFIKNQCFPIQKHQKEGGISFTHGDINLCREIMSATEKPFSVKGIDWTEEESIEILSRLLQWWDEDKDYLQNEDGPMLFGSINDEFKQRFANIVSILTHVVFPRISPQSGYREKLCRLLEELNNYGIPNLSAAVVSIIVFPEKKDDIYNALEISITSLNKEEILDAYNGIFQILILYKLGKIEEVPGFAWDSISQIIKWRWMPGLLSAMRLTSDIFENMSELIPEKFYKDVLNGLNHLIDETNLGCQVSTIDISERLDCRSEAASLAYSLYNYYIKNNKDIPEIVVKWKNICLSPEEFSEIRNQWE